MITKTLPRPRDPIALAKLIGDIATGQVEDGRDDDGKDAAAVSLGKRSGAAPAAAMTPERWVESAKNVAGKRQWVTVKD